MSEQRPPKLDGFSDGEYQDRPEYNPERVACQETDTYQHIAEYADYLLVATDCPQLIAESSPSVVYSSETRAFRRTLSRLEYQASPVSHAGLPIETQLAIQYEDIPQTPQLTRYQIEITKRQRDGLLVDGGMSELYTIETYDDGAHVTAEVIYPDVVNNNYAARAMTPYDEQNLYHELALMAAYVQVESEQTGHELASDGN